MKDKNMEHKGKQIEISEDIDIARAVIETKALSEKAGFEQTEQYMISTAVSELARNILNYAMRGGVFIRIIERGIRKGIEITAEDNGPGIKDIGKAMKDHFSTSESLGLGLPGTKRLMDEFVIDTERKTGTKITARKWL